MLKANYFLKHPLATALLCLLTSTSQAETPDNPEDVDKSKWFHQTVLPNGDSWYNNEQQHYTDRPINASTYGGYLEITAQKEEFTDQGVTKQFTSARLNSKFAFTYGRVEVRAQVPEGRGTWPAIWMLPKDIKEMGAYFDLQGYGEFSWPDSGEIDILEHWGRNQNYAQSAIHTRSSFGNTINLGGQPVPAMSSKFHTYSLDWDEEKLTFSVDGKEHYTYNPSVKNSETWPFDRDYYLLLNFAIEKDIDPSFKRGTFFVDYVRVYDQSGKLGWSDEFNSR
jgi:beta-glucanase (GH16 family)